MGNVYSAQNVAAYIIYELNDVHTFVNQLSIQHLLADVEIMWQKVYGHCAFSEATHSLEAGYVVKEVFDAYKEYYNNHIPAPAKEWFLRYGEFQLIHRPYGIPAYTADELTVMTKILDAYRTTILEKVSVAV
ncbi:hypothetical protein [Solibacillus sp. FSL H8-0538]|uniref:hypothetical protein n=1 Tax=Solibacillus sp. FSL H8-0538 TaxID=2921400 RepID=UPI0030F7F75A